MVTIPRVTAPTVDAEVTPEYQGPRGSFGPNIGAQQWGALGEAAQGAGRELMDIQAKMDAEADRQRVLTDLNELQGYTLAQQRAAREMQGTNARGSADALGGKWREKRDSIAGKLSPRQRLMFDQKADEIGLQHTDMLARNEWGKNQEATDAAEESSVVLHKQTAISNKDDLGAIAKSREDIFALIDARAARKGWSPEQVQLAKSKEMTEVHIGVIESIVDDDPERAEEYYKAVKGEVLPAQRDNIEKALKLSGQRVDAQTYVEKNFNVTDPKFDIEKARAKVRAESKGDKEDSRMKELNLRYVEHNAGIQERYKKAESAAWRAYGDSGDFAKVPSGILAQMEGEAFVRLKDYAERKAKGEKDTTNWETYGMLVMAAVEEPEKFLSEDITTHYPHLADAQKKQMHDLQAYVAGKTVKDNLKGSKMKDLATFNQQVNNLAGRMNWIGQENVQKREQFRAYAIDGLMAWEVANKKAADDNVREAILNEAVRQVVQVDSPIFFGKDKFRLRTDEEIAKYEPSADEIARFRAARPDLGTLSDDSIKNALRNALANRLKRATLGR